MKIVLMTVVAILMLAVLGMAWICCLKKGQTRRKVEDLMMECFDNVAFL